MTSSLKVAESLAELNKKYPGPAIFTHEEAEVIGRCFQAAIFEHYMSSEDRNFQSIARKLRDHYGVEIDGTPNSG